MITITYCDRGYDYASQVGVIIKTVRNDDKPELPKKSFAKGPGREAFFECHVDRRGNICDANGIIVFPSNSGRNPLKAGDKIEPEDYLE